MKWYIRDTGRKIQAVFKAKTERGERLGMRAPYGYRKDENGRKSWSLTSCIWTTPSM